MAGGREHWTNKGGVKLFLYEKRASPSPGPLGTILFVHGSSMASTPTFDLHVPAPLMAGIIADALNLEISILTICTISWLLCFIFYLGAMFTIKTDVHSLRTQMEERAEHRTRQALHQRHPDMDILQLDLTNRDHRKAFLELPFRIYADTPQWVPMLESDARLMLDTKKHPYYQHSQAAFFLAQEGGRTIGRLAVLDNQLGNRYNNGSEGFFYLFECENNLEAAHETCSTLAAVGRVSAA